MAGPKWTKSCIYLNKMWFFGPVSITVLLSEIYLSYFHAINESLPRFFAPFWAWPFAIYDKKIIIKKLKKHREWPIVCVTDYHQNKCPIYLWSVALLLRSLSVFKYDFFEIISQWWYFIIIKTWNIYFKKVFLHFFTVLYGPVFYFIEVGMLLYMDRSSTL